MLASRVMKSVRYFICPIVCDLPLTSAFARSLVLLLYSPEPLLSDNPLHLHSDDISQMAEKRRLKAKSLALTLVGPPGIPLPVIINLS